MAFDPRLQALHGSVDAPLLGHLPRRYGGEACLDPDHRITHGLAKLLHYRCPKL